MYRDEQTPGSRNPKTRAREADRRTIACATQSHQLSRAPRANTEGVYKFQPRVARVSALPWVTNQRFCPNPERVVEIVVATATGSRTLSEFLNRKPTVYRRAWPWAGVRERLRRCCAFPKPAPPNPLGQSFGPVTCQLVGDRVKLF